MCNIAPRISNTWIKFLCFYIIYVFVNFEIAFQSCRTSSFFLIQNKLRNIMYNNKVTVLIMA